MGGAERKRLEKTTRKKLIMDSAAEVFHQKGFSGATMENIAVRAQIAVGTIYIYFKSKADIYFSLTKPALESLANRLKRIANHKKHEPDLKVRQLMDAVEDFYIRNKDVYDLVTRNKAADSFQLFPEENRIALANLMRSNFKQMEVIVEEGIRKGLYRKINPYSVAIVFWSSFTGIIRLQENRLISGKKDYRKNTIDLFFKTILAGLKKEGENLPPD
jgi:AcrR family transcriptional regulator